MLITEFRVPMPLTLSEYERGQLYTCMEASKKETKKGEGVEILINEPFKNFPLFGNQFRNGQYTKKVYHVGSRIPKFIAAIAPKGSLTVFEESWNSYPFCRTILSNKRMGDDFYIQIDSFHVDKSRGEVDNIHELDEDKLNLRNIVTIDIGNDPLSSDWGAGDCENPAKFVSKKTKRGPLTGDWIQTVQPVMTCYKLVTAKFKWYGLQNTVEKFIMKTERKLFLRFHKQMFCWIDDWINLKISDIRLLEAEAQEQLVRLMATTSSPRHSAHSSYQSVSTSRNSSAFKKSQSFLRRKMLPFQKTKKENT